MSVFPVVLRARLEGFLCLAAPVSQELEENMSVALET